MTLSPSLAPSLLRESASDSWFEHHAHTDRSPVSLSQVPSFFTQVALHLPRPRPRDRHCPLSLSKALHAEAHLGICACRTWRFCLSFQTHCTPSRLCAWRLSPENQVSRATGFWLGSANGDTGRWWGAGRGVQWGICSPSSLPARSQLLSHSPSFIVTSLGVSVGSLAFRPRGGGSSPLSSLGRMHRRC